MNSGVTRLNGIACTDTVVDIDTDELTGQYKGHSLTQSKRYKSSVDMRMAIGKGNDITGSRPKEQDRACREDHAASKCCSSATAPRGKGS